MTRDGRENSTTPLSTSTDRRAVETRRRFITAAWELLDETQLTEILRSIPVERIVKRAERSERSFWNHFGDVDTFVEALLADVPRMHVSEADPGIPLDQLEEDLEHVDRGDLPSILMLAAANNWHNNQSAEEITTFLRQIMMVSRLPSQPALAPLVREHYWGAYMPVLESIYRTVGTKLGLQPIEPLSWMDFTVVLNSFVEGMQLHRLTAPELIDDDKVATEIVLIGLGLLTVAEDPEGLDERAAMVARPRTPTGSRVLELDGHASAVAAEWLVRTDAPREPRGWSEVAEIVELPLNDLLECLGRLEVLGARAMSELVSESAVGRPSGSREELLDWMSALVREFRSDPWCARCLLGERLGTDSGSTAALVDLGSVLASALGETRDARHDSAIDLLLTCALSSGVTTPEAVSEIVLAALPAMGDPGPEAG